MANEEIVVNFGGNLGPLGAALRGARGLVHSTAESMKDSFKDVFHHLSAPLSIAGAFEAVRSLMEDVKNIKRISESTGLDTGVTQDLLNLGKASGIAGDAIEAAMDKFVKNLAPGSDPEQALYNLADKMEGITDPTERARLAVDNFGKAGVKMIPILEQGSDGIKRMAEEWGKLSEAEIEELEHANQTVEKTESRAKVQLARTIEWIGQIAKAHKEASIGRKLEYAMMPWLIVKDANKVDEKGVEAEMAVDNAKEAQKTENAKAAAQKRKADALDAAKEIADKEAYIKAAPEEKILMLTRQILAAKREIEDLGENGSEKERAKIIEKIGTMEEKRQSLIEATDRTHKEAMRKELEMSQEIDKARLAITDAERKRDRERVAEYLPSLEEVANSGYSFFQGNRWKYQQGPYAGMAQEEMRLKARVTNELIWGNQQGANQDIKRIDELKKALADAGVQSADDKQEAANEAVTKSEKHLADLIAKANGDGIKVIGPED